MGHALDDLLGLAERAYVRMQAGQLIKECLEQGDSSLLKELVQQLVLTGAPSLAVLREIHEEIRSTGNSLRQEGMVARQDLKEALGQFGLHLPQILIPEGPEAFRRITGPDLRTQVRDASRGLPPEDQALLEEICAEASQRVAAVARQLALLGRLDKEVRDWLGVIAYEAARADPGPAEAGPPPRLH